jgi:cellulose synthase/poly-beta-1,6-N-acetylglucosamine synthase-like glycosyltransferase/peptidoglycan/xylan/chitin deacetylase (PgdA/CDA1 family)/spore germination protein YaaH
MSDRAAIFYDPTGRRRKRFRAALLLFALLVVLSLAGLAATIQLLPAAEPLPVALERGKPLPPPRSSLLDVTGRSLNNAILRLIGAKPPSPRRVGAKQAVTAAVAMGKPLSIGFYTPWDRSSTASLQRHIGDLDWLAPVWVTVTGPTHQFNVLPDPNGRAILNGAAHRPLILPVVQNANLGVWDAAGTNALLADPAARRVFLDQLVGFLSDNHANGAVFDFEQVDAKGEVHYRELLREAKARFGPRGWLVTVAAPVDANWDLARFAEATDRLFLMAYDEHSNDGPPGPIASQQWWASKLASALRQVPREKAIVTLGNYAYDWHDPDKNGAGGDPLNVEEAWLDAADSDAKPVFDRASGNSSVAYDDEFGHRHTLWILDAASAFNQMKLLDRAGLRSVALWRMGAEDPALWSIFGRGAKVPRDPAALVSLPHGTNVDVEGTGEILRISSLPTPGKRKLILTRDGMIAGVDFVSLPRPYVITRTNYAPNTVALTFDDGPDERWTPKILDILKAKGVPATFFIIGENALTERGLLNRMIAEGHEIGNHTYTHPNLATTGRTQTLFELNATQRLFQAFTGRTLKFFRAPFFGDAEPSTADEIFPALEAQQRGYISVGLHVDSEDWQRPGAQAIVNNVLSGVLAKRGNVVLLHDSGGIRTETIAALPAIIDRLRAAGYRFVPVSALAGLSRDQAMPLLSPGDRTAARVDLALFESLGLGVQAMGLLFGLAITLGILRALTLSGLALVGARRESRTVFPPIDPKRFVSVLIPAYNEERVIERSVRQVLASERVELEVIVIDDGSSDRTSEVVNEHFAGDPRVRLLTIANGGKANALNLGLGLANGEIVIALDADTQFEPTTIARLSRWFVDERIGAVAGNAKVGNRINLVTKWQALEYITAQNLERRALAQLGAMTVVPGAVGAWRKAAILGVGGYPPDTLAEDQDLTIAVQRAGWGVTYDQHAIAWTEAPQTLRQLAKQRFRWAFGTIQCLWKHKRIMLTGRPRGLAIVGLPQVMLFQLIFAMISPIIDLALIVNIIATLTSIHEHGLSAVKGDPARMGMFWLLFAAIDLVAGLIAFVLEKSENKRLLVWLVPMRFVYRQTMYYVVIKAIVQALRGPRVGWSSIARSGKVQLGTHRAG